MRFTVGKFGRFFVLLQVLLLIEAISCVMCSENRIVLQNSQNNQICARSSIPVDFSANPLLQINEQTQDVNQIEEQNSVIVERSVIPNKEGKTSFLVKKIFREVDNGIRICVGEEKEELENKYKVFGIRISVFKGLYVL